MLLLWASIGGLLLLSLQRTDGTLIYALDDPYIHMAMAKNMAQHGVWGVSSDGFTSSSSSILWTGALALFFGLFGVRDAIPFILNVLLASATLLVTSHLIARRFPSARPIHLFGALAVLAFATPLPALVFVGQEHILHVLCTLLFVSLAADLVAGPTAGLRSRGFVAVALLAAALVLIRYEGLYPVAAAGGLLVMRRRVREALTLGAAAAIPLAVYALISMAKGWWWAPNSILLKGNLPDWKTPEGLLNLLGYAGYSSLLALPAAAFLVWVAVALLAWRVPRGFWHPVPVMLAMFVAVALVHLQYSQPRAFWMFRYEAHLIALGVLAVLSALFERIREANTGTDGTRSRSVAPALLVGLLLVLSPLPDRAIRSAVRVPTATANIYEQQYQMGRFLREYYHRHPVALNDIGAPAYLADVKVLDLVGLASMDVAVARRGGWYSPAAIDDLTRDRAIRMAIVYDRWFPGALPAGWLKAGSWRIRNATVVGSDTVSFYALSRNEHARLVMHLREFERALPPGVRATTGP